MGFGVDEQLDSCPFWPTGLMSPVNTGTLTGGSVISCKEKALCPANPWVAAAQGTEQVVLVVWARAHGLEVVFTRPSFFHVWTLGRTSCILAWLEPKIFSFISL